ncbi:uncharacterized protein [Procambarus clarkii]|uniref:uncharacterized protein n=1 Tax=Procambarus clarkii TaxID=6728 RepID=UPI003743DB80
MEDEADGKLILKEEVKWEVREGRRPEAADVCPRLKVARKSLTRCKGIEETFDGEFDPCLQEDQKTEYEDENYEPMTRPESLHRKGSSSEMRHGSPLGKSPATGSLSSKMSEGEATRLHSPATPHTDRGSSCRSSSTEGCEDGRREGYDDISASMSVIRMEKFALEKRRVSRILPKCLHRTFVDKDVEQLFQAYHERQRRADLHILLVGGATFAAYSVTVCLADLQVPDLPAPLALASIGALQVLLLLLCRLHIFPERSWIVLPYIVWALVLAGVGVFVALGPHTPIPRQALLWLILLHFMLFVGLPLRLPACLILTTITAAAHLTTSALLMSEAHHGSTQVSRQALLSYPQSM